MSAHDFTIIDGVPKAVLALALKSAASDVATAAKVQLAAKGRALVQYIETPDGHSNRFPVADRLAVLVEEFLSWRDTYLEQKAIADRAFEQACELEELEGDSQADGGV